MRRYDPISASPCAAIDRPAFAPISMAVSVVWPPGTSGTTELSATHNPSIPWTRRSRRTTPIGSSPRKQPASQQFDAITPSRKIAYRIAAGSQRLGLPGVATRQVRTQADTGRLEQVTRTDARPLEHAGSLEDTRREHDADPCPDRAPPGGTFEFDADGPGAVQRHGTDGRPAHHANPLAAASLSQQMRGAPAAAPILEQREHPAGLRCGAVEVLLESQAALAARIEECPSETRPVTRA